MRSKYADVTDIVFHSQLKNFLEGDDRILTTYWVTLVVANVVVGSEEDPYCVIRGCDACVSRIILQPIQRLTGLLDGRSRLGSSVVGHARRVNKSQRLFSFTYINASHAFSTTLSSQHGSAKPSLKGYGGMSQ